MNQPRIGGIKLAVAAECLRQMWQDLDAGGRSMGRSQDAVLLETAIDLLPYDCRYCDLADNRYSEFDKIREDVRYESNKQRMNEEFERLHGYV